MKIFFLVSSLLLNTLLKKTESIVNYTSVPSNIMEFCMQCQPSAQNYMHNIRYHNIDHREATNTANQKNTINRLNETTLTTKANRYIAAVAVQDTASSSTKITSTATPESMQTQNPDISQIKPDKITAISAKDFHGTILSNYSSIFTSSADAYRTIYETYGGNAQYIVDGRILIRLTDDLFIDASVIDSAYAISKQPVKAAETITSAQSKAITTSPGSSSITADKNDDPISNNNLSLDSIIYFAQDKWSIKVNKNFIHSSQINPTLSKNIDIASVFKNKVLFVLRLESGQSGNIVNNYGNKHIFSMTDSLYSNKNHSIILDTTRGTLAVVLYANQKFSYKDMDVIFTRDNNNHHRYTNRFTIPNRINQIAEDKNANYTTNNTASDRQNNQVASPDLFQKSEILALYQKYTKSLDNQRSPKQTTNPEQSEPVSATTIK